MKKKSKITAGLLGIFLGTLGVHNFYIGSYGKAIAQLLITVLSAGSLAFISLCWGLVEGILILTNCIDINQKYRKEQGTIEENKEFAKETFKRFNSNRTPAIDYIKKHTRLSVEEIQQVENEFDLENEKLKEYKKSELEKQQNVIKQKDQEKIETKQEIVNNKQTVDNTATNQNSYNTVIGIVIILIIILAIGFGIFKLVSGLFGNYFSNPYVGTWENGNGETIVINKDETGYIQSGSTKLEFEYDYKPESLGQLVIYISGMPDVSCYINGKKDAFELSRKYLEKSELRNSNTKLTTIQVVQYPQMISLGVL